MNGQRALRWIGVAFLVLILLLPGVQWLSTSRSLWMLGTHTLPVGQVQYVLCKLVGLYTLALLGLQLVYGLLGPARSTLGWQFGLTVHRATGFVVLGLAALHATSFIWAASSRSGHLARDYLWPQFTHGYYLSRIAMGWCAAIALILLASSGALRSTSQRLWRCVHWLAIPTGAAIAYHSLSIGTETRMPLMRVVYVAMLAMVMLSVILRFKGRLPTDPRDLSLST